MKLDPTNISAMNYNEGINAYLKDICAPLFTRSGVTVFEYTKVFFDETCLNISTNHHWLVHNYTKCPMGTLLERNLQHIPVGTTRYIPFGYNKKDLENPMLAQSHSFDIWNGLNVYKRYEKECECFVFVSTRENTEIMDFYMNEKVFLERFILYFKEKARPFIESFDMSKRTVLHKSLAMDAPPISQAPNLLTSKDFTPKKFLFHGDEGHMWLSRREAQCLCLYAYGKTARDIAATLGVALQTVQTHINNIKLKSNLSHKSELVELFHYNIGTEEHMKIFL